MMHIPACKKENEGSIPVIEMISPSENTAYTLPDSIYVNVKISDSRNITSVKVQLVNEEYLPVLPAYFLNPNSPSTRIEKYYQLDPLIVKTGKYYLLIRAENESQFRNKYQPIMMTGLVSEFNQLLIITSPSDNILEVSGLKLDGEPYPLFEVDGDYSDSDIDNQSQQLFLAGKNKLNVAAYDINSGEERWRQQDIAYMPMHNDNCLHFAKNNILYTSFNDQHILGYDITGKITFDATIDLTDAPGTIVKHSEFVLVDIQKKNSSQPFIRTYSALTGAEKQSKLSLMQVIEFFSYSNDSVIVCGNEGDFGRIYSYDVQKNSNTDILYFDSPIVCVEPIGFKKLLVGLEQGLSELDLITGIPVELQQEIGYSVIRYEKYAGRIFMVKDKQLFIYTYPEMEYQKTVTFSDTILDILLSYSK